jgi:hypothetical protein
VNSSLCPHKNLWLPCLFTRPSLRLIYIGEVCCYIIRLNRTRMSMSWTYLGFQGGSNRIVSYYGLFTLVTFVCETVSNIYTRQEIETILSVSCCPRWPRQVQWWLSPVAFVSIIMGIIALNFASVNTALLIQRHKSE